MELQMWMCPIPPPSGQPADGTNAGAFSATRRAEKGSTAMRADFGSEGYDYNEQYTDLRSLCFIYSIDMSSVVSGLQRLDSLRFMSQPS